MGRCFEIKEQKKIDEQEQEQTLVQIKTRKYSATPIKDVVDRGSFVLGMARKTSVDVNLDHPVGEDTGSRRKIKHAKGCGDQVCFTCCGQHEDNCQESCQN